jgi:polyphosphate kinase 2
MSKAKDYKQELRELQIGLVRFQEWAAENGTKVVVVLEGRDSAGKDGAIARITEHLTARRTRAVALPKPNDRDRTEWYFQRYVHYLPAAGEFVIFNRSWYNRAGVERVMGFCTQEQVKEFFESVVPFEAMLVRDGISLRKYYLDISKHEQKKRLKARADDPLKQWKTSSVDEVAIKNWKKYSKARDEMFEETNHLAAPWNVVRANEKKTARLEFIRDLLAGFDYKGKSDKLAKPDPDIVFPWSEKRTKLIAE